tara:strand:- start:100 stop:378 length:279 start_codon:yes stop_codon:yes gene_type:complete
MARDISGRAFDHMVSSADKTSEPLRGLARREEPLGPGGSSDDLWGEFVKVFLDELTFGIGPVSRWIHGELTKSMAKGKQERHDVIDINRPKM